jgi:hypothetical protein
MCKVPERTVTARPARRTRSPSSAFPHDTAPGRPGRSGFVQALDKCGGSHFRSPEIHCDHVVEVAIHHEGSAAVRKLSGAAVMIVEYRMWAVPPAGTAPWRPTASTRRQSDPPAGRALQDYP